jgi:carboxyl-terminal processing protease
LPDFDALWETTRDAYCFFADKAVDWNQVRALYRPRAAAARSVEELHDVLDAALCELYDPHNHVNTQRDGARRYVPFDLWAEWRDGRAIVTAVRSRSMASTAHVEPGTEILTLDGRPIADAAHALLPRCMLRADPAAEAWRFWQRSPDGAPESARSASTCATDRRATSISCPSLPRTPTRRLPM